MPAQNWTLAKLFSNIPEINEQYDCLLPDDSNKGCTVKSLI